MGFRQTYKGIFQFRDQATLDVAMAETEAEALEADAMGLQDSFRGEGVMLLNIETTATEEDWEAMGIALATLAMHASKGFAYAVAQRDVGTEVDFFDATGEGETPVPTNSDTAPSPEEDYFTMEEGAHYVFRGVQHPDKEFDWTTHVVEAHGRKYYYFQDTDAHSVHFSQYWDGTFYYKDKSLVDTVDAGNITELKNIDPKNSHSSQIIYNHQGEVGEMLYTIWKHDDVFVILTNQGFEDVTVPFGDLKDCMKIRVEVFKIEEEKMTQKVHHQYFAEGIGLVKWEAETESLVLVEHSSPE